MTAPELQQIISKALAVLGNPLDTLAAAQLLLGTAIQESNLEHRRQLGGGPGRGLYQMELHTHEDIWNNYLRYRAPLAAAVKSFRRPRISGYDDLEHNDLYASAMARVHYARTSEALPALNDISGMAHYWKKYYNTPLGAGSAAQFIANWNRVMG